MRISLIIASSLSLILVGARHAEGGGQLRQTPSPTITLTLISTAWTITSTSTTIVDPLDGDTFCFGEGSICGYPDLLYDDCQSTNDLSDPTPLYKCLCGNGYASVNQQCYWCQRAFHQFVYYDNIVSACESYGFSVAPIPSSIQAAESSFNATATDSSSETFPTFPQYTSTIDGGGFGGLGATATGGGSIGATATSTTKVGGAIAVQSKAAVSFVAVVSAFALFSSLF